MIPAPTITTSAVSATPPPYGKREPGSTESRLNRRRNTAIMAAGGSHMATIDPVWASVAELSRSFEGRTLSPVDVVEALLGRIRRRNPDLHAFIAVYEPEARLAAEAADKAIRSGHCLGSLHGVPVRPHDLPR